MIRSFTYTITKEFQHLTIEEFLKIQGYSRAVLIHLKKTPQSITLNDIWVYVRTKLSLNDILKIHIIEEQSSENIIPVSIPFTIVYEDDDILVIDKPANMPIHPSQNNYDNTLANAVVHYYANQRIPYVFRCINRLDKNTTGLTLLAKNMLSSCILSTMVKKREIQREYLAIVNGTTPAFGTIKAPIGRVAGSTIERFVDLDNGDEATTHFKRLAVISNRSLLSITLETGRTHQIRVHMKHIGHPLPGDFLYCPDYTLISRQALHSHKLTFKHPITKEPFVFEAPLPIDMASLLQ